ncbi:MAG: [acyl-carrier-protein] S-malonyltransferase [Omnitrophica WOR_2 bacterium RBG_13_41_10]|nr:MAG: [acyl-carrier-protein] S-malonyltransferase [Omnitrophica WOR_2 bacterium RBG_13_41_10]
MVVGFLFAGQGAQYIGMGQDLYESFPESKKIFDKADEVLGMPLSRLCFQGPQEELTKTNNCQPAILTMSIAAWEAFSSVHGTRYTVQNYAAGLSLGEYSALVAAKAMSFEDAVSVVRKRGQFMEEEAQKFPGKMASVLGLGLELVRNICQKTNTEIANINSPGQIVISGEAKAINEAVKVARGSGAKKVILLEVSGAFHSSLMKGASLKLAKELEKLKINQPQITLISNINAQPVESSSEIKNNLIQQVASAVLWEDSMRYMLSRKTENFFEIGPGKVLKGLMRRIDENAQVTNIEKKEDLLNCLKL